jgi:outer membrane protein TolC
MMKKRIILFTAMLLPMLANAEAQAGTDAMKLTLPEAIAMARTQSVDAVVARGELRSAYWEYRTYQADMLPELTFEGTLPQYNKSYSSYQQDDGAYKFVRNDWVRHERRAET